MRSLVLQAVSHTIILEEPGRSRITAVCHDVDEDFIYSAVELMNADADVDVSIWKTSTLGSSEHHSGPELITTITTPSLTPDPNSAEIISMRFVMESRTLVVVTRSGDITSIPLNIDPIEADVVGSVDFGILAAAWSPDDSLLVLVTGDRKLILMTSAFDVLSEAPLHTSDFGEDAPINVGWGSKQTQFHGSLGKAAAQAPSASLSSIGFSPDDDTLPRISWRGDGAYFVVSVLSPQPEQGLSRRIFRVYDRQAALQSTSEPVAGLEHPLAWRPSGNLIASTQRFGFEGGGSGKEGRHDLVFFERNGLRHGEFGIREADLKPLEGAANKLHKWGYKVKELSWSSDSNVLAVWIEMEETDLVQLWTTGNYHWYLKQEICPFEGSSRFTSITWHPERALHLSLTTTSQLIQRIFAWDTFASKSGPLADSGSVAVVDGTSLLLTPFRMQNVPPPMSACQLSLINARSPVLQGRRAPVHVTFSPAKDVLAVLWSFHRVQLWDLRTRQIIGRGKVMDPVLLWEGEVGRSSVRREARQISLWTQDTHARVAVLSTEYEAEEGDILTLADIRGDTLVGQMDLQLPARNGWLLASLDKEIAWQSVDGEIFPVTVQDDGVVLPTSRFPEFCLCSSTLTAGNSGTEPRVFVGLADSGKLYAANPESRCRALSSSVNSFVVTSDFVIFTTTSHEAHFVPLESLPDFLSSSENIASTQESWERRRVERGSRIVTAVPSAMTLVLQMPRGNLETINPRPLVMRAIVRDVEAGRYRKAFLAARKHRIDLSTLVNRDANTFMANIPQFVEQVEDIEYMNLFLTSLGSSSLDLTLVAKLCDLIRTELEAKDLKKYISSIMTSYVVKTPPEHELALQLLLRLRDSEPDLVEDAVKYIIFLVDTDKLLDTALGMYDFSIFLMIAQHAQKDPREYLPFLRELRSYERYYQRFKIDDHLKQYEKALKNLSLAGEERFDEAIEYVERHRLYELALSLWKDTDHYASVLDTYGDWLFERREFRQAALAFLEADKRRKALIAYEKALDWQELFDVAISSDIADSEIVNMGWRVSGYLEGLISKKRFADAATVLLDYSKDVRHAVIALVEGNLFSEARRIISLRKVPDLLTELIHPAILESRNQISEDIGEMKEQLRKQLQRIRELRIRKVEEPDAFYGVEDTALHNVDVMTDVSMAPTAFTRYTAAPSTASRTTKRSSRSKRKMERKVGSGRKGTVDEEEYLLNSVAKLVNRFMTTQVEAGKLLPHLFQFTSHHRKEGLSLQEEIIKFEEELKDAVEETWRKSFEVGEAGASLEDSWATRMDRLEKDRMVDPLDKVPRPEIPLTDWRVTLLDTCKS
ncbi:IkappaB kinase complex IKAP component [Neolentinus lepideus HHB14362 ss-1]|uniref:Elongator complex protein 1 n=1 Tax=Neolentinus lepideus HHB14362 ss-1 TaxID=1314782 RepID=A0A165TSL1_9AGAM|nr:IkappaB kinase complex IKAP component [Neolentinus lepideus HHB14362 ss-1]